MYNDYYKNEEQIKPWTKDSSFPPIPKYGNPIICPACGQPSGYTYQDVMHLVIREPGLKCKKCGHIVIKPRRYMC